MRTKCNCLSFLFLVPPMFAFPQEQNAGNVYFASNSSKLTTASTRVIDGLLASKKITANHFVLLYGYSDPSGTKKEKEQVSTQRAKKVRDYLVEKKGFPDYNVLICRGLGSINGLQTEYKSSDSEFYSKVEIVAQPMRRKRVKPTEGRYTIEMKNPVEKRNNNVEKGTTNLNNNGRDKTPSPGSSTDDIVIGKLNTEQEKVDPANVVLPDRVLNAGKSVAIKIENEHPGIISDGEIKHELASADNMPPVRNSENNDNAHNVLQSVKENDPGNLPVTNLKTTVENRRTSIDEQKKMDSIVKSLVHIVDSDKNMIFVEGGLFSMGNDEGEDSTPIHLVQLNSYFISNHEVTIAEFRKFIVATGYKTTAQRQGVSWVKASSKKNNDNDVFLKKEDEVSWEDDENGIKRTRDDRPVLHISWHDAERYCEWLSHKTGKKYRLPTDAEWEFAAKGGNKNVDISRHNTGSKTMNSPIEPVKTTANEIGLSDLNGPNWEWCNDWYNANYYTHQLAENPKGPKMGTMKVQRGGSWYECPGVKRYTCRFCNYPSVHGGYVSFRVAKDM